MKDDEIISPSWDDTEAFLVDQDASQDVIIEFNKLRRMAEKKGDGKMMGYYPVMYLEQNGQRRGYSIDYDLFMIPQGDDFKQKIGDPSSTSIKGSNPLESGTVKGESELPEGINYDL